MPAQIVRQPDHQSAPTYPEPAAIANRPRADLVHTKLVVTAADRRELLAVTKSAAEIAVDTETTGLQVHLDKIIGLCISVPPYNAAYYMPLHNSPEGTIWYDNRSDFDDAVVTAKSILEDDSIPKIFFNALYDVPILYKNFGIVTSNISDDVLLLSHVSDPDSSHHLKDLAVIYIHPLADCYQRDLDLYNESVGGSSSSPKFWLVPAAIVAKYGGADAAFTGALKDKLLSTLDRHTLKVYYDVNMVLMHALLGMRCDGIPLDIEYLRRGSIWYEHYCQYLVDEMRRILNDPTFNPLSTASMADTLYNKLKLPRGRQTVTGSSTDKFELRRLRKAHPVIEYIIEYRTAARMKSAYFDAFLTEVQDGVFYPDPKIHGTVIGRLSMNRLHQIPRGEVLRKAFIAGEGRKLVGGDFAQQDARILANLTRDPVLVDTFTRDLDIHSVTAKYICNLDCDVNDIPKLHPDARKLAKAVNFALFTMESPHGLAVQLDTDIDTAKMYYEQFFSIYRGIKPWAASAIMAARGAKCVRSIMGRRRYPPGIEKEVSIPRVRRPQSAPNCFGRQPPKGYALSIIYDLGIDPSIWTPSLADSIRPQLKAFGRDYCAQCPLMFECYLSVAAGSIRREQEELDRKIISTIIQASTADCVNTGLANTYLHCIQNGIDHKIHLFVHDEVVFSVPTNINIDLFVADIKRIMESPGIPLVVPLRFDPKIGDTWADLKG